MTKAWQGNIGELVCVINDNNPQYREILKINISSTARRLTARKLCHWEMFMDIPVPLGDSLMCRAGSPSIYALSLRAPWEMFTIFQK